MRPIILGMNNPLSADPRHALYPHPPGCTGHRLLELLRRRLPGVTREQYLRAFDRRNLVSGKTWNNGLAKLGADALVSEVRDTGRYILVLGEPVRLALGLSSLRLVPVRWQGCTWRQVPHLSGRCRWYNEEFRREVVAGILQDMYEESER